MKCQQILLTKNTEDDDDDDGDEDDKNDKMNNKTCKPNILQCRMQ